MSLGKSPIASVSISPMRFTGAQARIYPPDYSMSRWWEWEWVERQLPSKRAELIRIVLSEHCAGCCVAVCARRRSRRNIALMRVSDQILFAPSPRRTDRLDSRELWVMMKQRRKTFRDGHRHVQTCATSCKRSYHFPPRAKNRVLLSTSGYKKRGTLLQFLQILATKGGK